MFTKLDNTAKLVLYDKLENVNTLKSKKLFYHFSKRLFDVVVSFLCLFLLIPIAIIIKILNIMNKDFDSIFTFKKELAKMVNYLNFINLEVWFLMQMKNWKKY